MATVKIKFRPSSVDGKEGTVYYQVIHVRVARQISTSYRLFPAEWDKRRARIVAAPSDEGRRQPQKLHPRRLPAMKSWPSRDLSDTVPPEYRLTTY